MKRYLLLVLVVLAGAAAILPTVAHTAPTPPTGLTAVALDAKVSLAWQTSSGATSYRVYRGTTSTSLALVGTSATTTYTDSTAANGTTYFYAVSAVNSTESTRSAVAQAKPVARTCSTGNAVVQENCFPGSTGWKLTNGGRAYDNGIEGFASAISVNQGGSVNLKVNTGPTGDGAPYHIEIYRFGWYGGTHGRLMGTIPGQVGVDQESCQDGDGNTGLLDCSNWATTQTITTSANWPSGVYWLRLVRDDNGSDNAIILTVRQDGSHSGAVYEVPTSTYEAYNNYGGKSLYTFNSSGSPTISGTPRAVKVSYDRPFTQSYDDQNDFFPQADLPNVGFLERSGYDVTYISDTDVHTTASLLTDHKTFISGAHSEYWSQQMRDNTLAARNAGVGLFFTGANQVYWRIRFESNPFSGGANRVQAVYKTTESGATDPVSPTGTWRDPAGANAPENALTGNEYVGDNDFQSYPLIVDSTEGKNRIWRHTAAASLSAGQSATYGTKLVGWEWDDRASNGQEPAGTTSWQSSPTTGNILQDSGRVYATGPGMSTGTAYKAASGAWVVSTGTNNWDLGLDVNYKNVGEPNDDIQQATTNILADMGSRPTTPISGVVVDPAGGPTVLTKTPTAGATGIGTTSAVTVTFDSTVDTSSLTGSTFFLKTAAGATVAATISYDNATNKATLTPSSPLAGNASYTATVKGGSSGVAGWGGTLAADVTWSFTTGAGTPPTVLTVTPADGATGVQTSANVTVKFDRDMLASSITTSNITLTPQLGTPVAASVTYTASTDTATLTPTSALTPSRQYTVTISSNVKGADGTAMSADKTTTFTTIDALTIATKTPAPLATGVSPSITVKGAFNRALDTSTVTATNVTLKNPSNVTVSSTLTYDAGTKTVSIQPNASLALNTTYTVRFAAAVKGTDGSALGADVTWTFTTASSAPPAPTITGATPAAGATAVPTDTTVTATFSRAMDPSTITGQTFVLRDPSNATVASTVSYNSSTNTATLTPTSYLSSGTTYTVQLTTGVRAADGTALAANSSRTFTTADCPCTVMNTLAPVTTGLDVSDGRPGTGLTYELGTRFTVSKTMRLTAIRYYKDAGETGTTHTGRLWNGAGVQVGSATFSGESASGWQQAALSAPVTLAAGTTYTVSVGLNTKFVMTSGGLSTALVNGPLSTVPGASGNGVYGNAAGTYPTGSWNSSNYFVAPVVANPTASNPPQVASRTPVSGATGVDTGTPVTVTFGNSIDSSTITGSTFTLQTSGGSAVAASVSYNSATSTATLTPSSPLTAGATYTATLTTGVKSDDGTPLASAVTWSFTTTAPVAPTVTSKAPAAGATGVSVGASSTATFSVAMDATTLTSSTVQLVTADASPVSATVAYDAPTRTVTLTPNAPLNTLATYTATITTGAKSAAGVALASPVSWSFTTAGCPCSTMTGLTPASTGNDVADGRSGTGLTYELGTKIQVSATSSLTGIRFWKDAGETGTHVGTLWDASGAVLGQATFTSETASGWQQQSFASPVTLSPGNTYTVSVGFNTKFALTGAGLASARTSGPLSTVVGSNGVYGNAAGTFPTNSWNNSNYFVDAVVQ